MLSPRRPYRVVLAAIAAAACAGLSGIAATVPAAAAGTSATPKAVVNAADQTSDPVPGGFASWQQLLAVQEELNTAADRIKAAAEPAGTAAGYAGIIAAPEDRALQLFWKGELPDSVRQAIAAAGPAAPVQVRPAEHTRQELLQQAREIIEAGRDAGVTAVAPLPDGSGVRVAVSTPVDGARDLPGVREASVPVRIEAGQPAPVYDRFHDTSPYWGGAGWFSGANSCTTGFAIRNYATGLQSLLTAGHCAANGATAFTVENGFGVPIGTFGGKNKSTDTAAITVFTEAAGRIYWGDNNTSGSKAVSAAASSWVGNWICTSGAPSGTRCSGQVVSTDETITIDNSLVFPLVRAERPDHTNLAGNGDSGGPVAHLSPKDPGAVYAKGIIVANDLAAPATCTGVPGSTKRKCSWAVYYTDIFSAMWPYNAGLVYWH